MIYGRCVSSRKTRYSLTRSMSSRGQFKEGGLLSLFLPQEPGSGLFGVRCPYARHGFERQCGLVCAQHCIISTVSVFIISRRALLLPNLPAHCRVNKHGACFFQFVLLSAPHNNKSLG